MLDRILPRLSPAALLLLSCIVLTLGYNRPFWSGVVATMPMTGPGDVLRLAGYAVVLIAAQFILFLPLANRLSVRPLLALLVLVAAGVSYFTTYYGVYFDMHMVDNVLQTNAAEAVELVTPRLVLHVFVLGVLPAAMLLRWPLAVGPRRAAVKGAAMWSVGGALVLAASLAFSYQGLSSLMRTDTELRHLITPANALVSTLRVIGAASPGDTERHPIGEDARRVGTSGSRPRVLVLVVGETVRAANWGLSGYVRETTPRLATRNLVNFTNVAACGTSTAVSLPCMFSPISRAEFNRRDARGQESMLDILQRVGYRVIWLDNQSGCKGVCDGVEHRAMDPAAHPDQCGADGCLDGALVAELEGILPTITSDTVIVLHQLGNHGPAYSLRYPDSFRLFKPTCEMTDLARCSQQEVVNSYDNSILYTDALLDAVIQLLDDAPELATALLYLSDHGESLGEHGIYLHGLPYSIAPDAQTHVPMVWWSSTAFDGSIGLSHSCLADHQADALSHDNLFHSTLGMLGVESAIVRADLDITRGCRTTAAAQLAGTR